MNVRHESRTCRDGLRLVVSHPSLEKSDGWGTRVVESVKGGPLATGGWGWRSWVVCMGVLGRVPRVSSRWRGVSESASQQRGSSGSQERSSSGRGVYGSRAGSGGEGSMRSGRGSGGVEEMETIWGWGLSHEGNREGTVVI